MRLIALTSLALALVAFSMPITIPIPNDLTQNLPPTVLSNANLQKSGTVNPNDVVSNPALGPQPGVISGSPTGSGPGNVDPEPNGATGSGLAGADPQPAQPINGVQIGRRIIAPPSPIPLSAELAGVGSQTETATGGPLSGTNSGGAAGLIHGASNTGGTSGNGNVGDVGGVTGAIPGASGAANGMFSGAGSYIQSAENGGPSGDATGITRGGANGAVGPISGAVSGAAEGSPALSA
ncbi:hypothetical protein PAXINDRAFT_101316 [Paxillus involutus ATCC 200175]|uniref:Uncharacterized protein n=1 Tax=Paxillus involutus ATCC 200175 TaxID=664439 RepID=A0A0C9TNX0_PAXIN|nr:hypothetical protein PAXINDRAFT_101316 [Paxillus involutus ATCC 200175]